MNIVDLRSFRIGSRIKRLDAEQRESAIAEMRDATQGFIDAWHSRDEFRILAASERADAARLRLIALMDEGA